MVLSGIVVTGSESLERFLDLPTIVLSVMGTLIMVFLEGEDKKLKTLSFRKTVLSIMIALVFTFLFSHFKDVMLDGVYYTVLVGVACLSPNTVRILYKELPRALADYVKKKVNE